MEERILVLAPHGRDAQVIERLLERDGTRCHVCPDLEHLRTHLENDVGGMIVTEEALAGPGLEPLLDWCDAQLPWSDIPVIVLARKQPRRRAAAIAGILERLGNVMLLERPLNAETLASAARASLRARRRQYQARALLLEREQNESSLRDLNETLERRVEERARALDKAREILAFALDSADMGSWDLDLASDTSSRTLRHDRIFGYADPLPYWGREMFMTHVIEEERPAVADAFANAIVKGVLDLECRVRRTDGAIRWIAAKGRVGRDPEGRAVRMAGVIMDTTERRLTEDTLHQAQKMEAIGQLTGGVAHDFNNLLTVIVGALDMVTRRPEQTSRVVRLAEAAMTAARRGEQLTQQLLAFSRRQMLRPRVLDPNALLLEFEALAQRAVGETIALRFDLDPAASPILVDPAQFESAVLNLMVNARDAMPRGGVITVASRLVQRRTRAPDDAGSASHPPMTAPHVLVRVSDTGEGIDAATLARAFEPFFTTKEVGKGSGLGLSQVYGFTRGAGGDVSIESKVGGGTAVSLYLPRSEGVPAGERIASPDENTLRSSVNSETVLLVEDDEQVLSMAVESLEELRYKVIVARNAQEALAHIRGPGEIDVMFSDVVMPGGMDGGRLADEARRCRPDMKVLLTSGYVGEFASDCSIARDLEVLTKPYRRDELARKLRMVLDQA